MGNSKIVKLQSYNVKIFHKANRPYGQTKVRWHRSYIYIQCIVPGEPPFLTPLGPRVKPEQFDKSEGKLNKLHPNHNNLNKLIQWEILQIENHISNLILSNQIVTIRAIRKLFEEHDDSKTYLFEFTEAKFTIWEKKKVYTTEMYP